MATSNNTSTISTSSASGHVNLTLDSLAFDLWLTVRNGKISDDDDLDIRQIKFWIKNNRAVWIKNELNKGRPVSQKFIQDVNDGCVELERVDVSTCPLVNVGQTLLRTTIDIPNTIERGNIPMITRVGPATVNSGSYFFIPYERVPYVSQGHFNSNAIYAFWLDNRIYLVSGTSNLNYSGMKKCNIRGVFADPEAVPGYDATLDYPITEHLWVYMKDIILKSDVTMFLSTLSDEINDSSAAPAETQEGHS
jgi:hypothetical protein